MCRCAELNARAMPHATLQVDGMQWWRAVVKGEPEINTQQVEPENSNLADLGE